ncbi:MAG: hypothetical protein EA362_09680 [Saprospirales bacterium]|nr:MAG: hypothetical protein EA362_09680 [Saprospirales bacterium]
MKIDSEKFGNLNFFYYLYPLNWVHPTLDVYSSQALYFMSLNVITASAGSGKTFRLTTEYLKLSLTKSPSYFTRILGITFTNKAANEMKENILKELDLIVKNPDKSNQLEHLKDLPEFGGDVKKVREKAALVQRNILLSYHDFSLTTIDSFFQRIIRAFFRDLGLASNFDVELNSDQVVSDALNHYLKKMKADDPLMQIISNIQEDLIRDAKSPNYKNELKKLSREIFKEHKLPDTRKNKDRLKEIKSELYQYVKTADETFEIFKDEARKILEKYNLEPHDFSGKGRSFVNYLIRREAAVAYEIPTGSTWLKALESVEVWYAKSAPQSTIDQIVACSNELQPLMQNIQEHLLKTKENYLSNVAIIKSFNSFEAISYLKAIVRDYIKENNLFLLGETYEMLKDFLKETDSPLVYERIGNRYNHIFVDEFQDTSRYQYDNIRPLISENMASGDSNLVVGDIKQAIYRFRNGDWRMLKYDVHEDFQDIIQDSLRHNWRSDKDILNFNNDLFKFLPEKLSTALDLKIGESMPEWSQMKESKAIREIYSDAEQQYPSKGNEKSGYVQLEFFDLKGSKKEDLEAQLFRRMEGELLDLEKRGFRPGQIAMLTRTRTEGRKLIEWLTDMQAKYPESKIFEFFSEEVLSIGDSPAVETVVSLMKLVLLGKSNQRYKQLLLLQFSHFSKKAGLSNPLHKDEDGLFIKTSSNIPKELDDLISTGISQGIKGLFSSIVSYLGLGREDLKKHFYYLAAFADEIDEYSKKNGDDLSGYLKYWEEDGREKNVEPPSSPDKISIMTVHKSKGLAFDVVFMPFAGVDLMPKNDTIIWVKDDRFTDDDEKAQMFPITASSTAPQSRFKSEYWTEVMYNWLDQLNVFYVGCTRPRNALFIYAYGKEDKESSLIPFLKAFAKNKLIPMPVPPNEHEEIEVYSFVENPRKNLVPKSSEASTNKTITLENYNSAQQLPQIKTTEIKAGIASAEAGDRTAIEEGLLMHRILELVIRKSDLPKALLQVIEEGHMAENEYDEWKSRIQAAFGLDPVANWFEDGIEVLNERDILLPDGRRYRPDRVVLKGTKAIVIDYKTGRPYAHYQKQMGVYCAVLHEMGYDETEAWLFYTDAMKTEKVN